MGKNELTYYDMGDRMSNMYRPIDEYLTMTKRFSPSAIRRSNMGKLMMIGPFCLLSVFIIFIIFNTKDMDMGMKLVISLIPLVFFLFTGYALRYIIKEWNTPHPDMLSCRNILDRDGLENVYKDFQTAKDLNERLRIGARYLFIKNVTVIRLADITKTDLDIIRDDESGGVFFTVFVKDELGDRKYHLKDLSRTIGLKDMLTIGSDNGLKDKIKSSDSYRYLDSAIEERRKRLETLDIEGLPGD